MPKAITRATRARWEKRCIYSQARSAICPMMHGQGPARVTGVIYSKSERQPEFSRWNGSEDAARHKRRITCNLSGPDQRRHRPDEEPLTQPRTSQGRFVP